MAANACLVSQKAMAQILLSDTWKVISHIIGSWSMVSTIPSSPFLECCIYIHTNVYWYVYWYVWLHACDLRVLVKYCQDLGLARNLCYDGIMNPVMYLMISFCAYLCNARWNAFQVSVTCARSRLGVGFNMVQHAAFKVLQLFLCTPWDTGTYTTSTLGTDSLSISAGFTIPSPATIGSTYRIAYSSYTATNNCITLVNVKVVAP
jgi:hypothetical protein